MNQITSTITITVSENPNTNDIQVNSNFEGTPKHIFYLVGSQVLPPEIGTQILELHQTPRSKNRTLKLV